MIAQSICSQRIFAKKGVAMFTSIWARVRCGQRNKQGRGSICE